MKRAQKGFGLVEMMISMGIGLVLLLGISAILLSMTRTAELRRKMADIQGGQRLAITLIGNSVRYAGSFPYSAPDTKATIFPVVGSFGEGQSLIGASPDGKDTVSVRFIASTSGSAAQGCSAQLVAGNKYTNVFSVTDGYLTCVETNTTSGAVTTAKLIAGLTEMNILYGVDTTGAGFVTKYLTATEVTSPDNLWDNVKTLKVNLVFTNPLAGEAGQSGKPTVSITQTIPHVIGL